MITDTIKNRQDLITGLIHADHIYATMYGLSIIEDRIIEIKTKEIWKFVFDWNSQGPAFIYLWGWPGPDGNTYLIDDYGKTWAFTEKELTTEGEE